jgi:hypothetical protein
VALSQMVVAINSIVPKNNIALKTIKAKLSQPAIHSTISTQIGMIVYNNRTKTNTLCGQLNGSAI